MTEPSVPEEVRDIVRQLTGADSHFLLGEFDEAGPVDQAARALFEVWATDTFPAGAPAPTDWSVSAVILRLADGLELGAATLALFGAAGGESADLVERLHRDEDALRRLAVDAPRVRSILTVVLRLREEEPNG